MPANPSKRKRTPTKVRKSKPRRERPAVKDGFGRKFLKLKGTISPEVDLEF